MRGYSPTERRLLQLMATEEMDDHQIAQQLGMSVVAMQNRRRIVIRKIGGRGKDDAVQIARRLKLIN